LARAAPNALEISASESFTFTPATFTPAGEECDTRRSRDRRAGHIRSGPSTRLVDESLASRITPRDEGADRGLIRRPDPEGESILAHFARFGYPRRRRVAAGKMPTRSHSSNASSALCRQQHQHPGEHDPHGETEMHELEIGSRLSVACRAGARRTGEQRARDEEPLPLLP
jgi:hypothetical protein